MQSGEAGEKPASICRATAHIPPPDFEQIVKIMLTFDRMDNLKVTGHRFTVTDNGEFGFENLISFVPVTFALTEAMPSTHLLYYLPALISSLPRVGYLSRKYSTTP